MIHTLRANDCQCVFLTNQQHADEENNGLPTVVATARDYPSGKFESEEKAIVKTQNNQTNVQIKQILKESDAFHRFSLYFPLSIL